MQRETRPTILIAALGLVVSVTLALLFFPLQEWNDAESGLTATALLTSPGGTPMGKVTLEQSADGVLVQAEAHGLSPGGHAVSVYAVGSCMPGLSSDGETRNMAETDSKGIGLRAQGDSQAGLLPNIYASDNGTARADFFTDAITILADVEHSVFDEDGSAIIIHEKPDPYMGEENPDTGFLVACGVIEKDTAEFNKM